MGSVLQETELSPDQVTEFRESGWTVVRNVVPRETALALRESAIRTADENRPPEVEFDATKNNYINDPRFQSQHRLYPSAESVDDLFASVVYSPRIAGIARSLLDCDEVRHLRSIIMEKTPAAQGGQQTSWHQDFPFLPIDRSRSLSVWVALMDLPAEMGTLRFVTGSHRLGSLGRDAHMRPDADRLERFVKPDLVSPPLSLKAGDATIHADLTIHGAAPNQSDESRWAVSIGYMDADSLYTGAPNRLTDGLGIPVNTPLDHAKFPVVR
ncbi:phytanoyl-CoA dioxygenase family protein [Amycolatopsis sp. Poz14]|uniref:phytanoyl-CoA dioxygenase family protein n=1 Tax=Amycolatopsis sp. Poz14 TaxID=1447705 RepID=UPI001EE830C8|nr:phytanoyl-CoA dioxygenase family protein [Amycolatopsis sp. Poz14]MCG3753979.1 phytanoyl-CoA dioxygenase family protein [Amycolatopsis sp. Poz14]